MGHFNRKFRRHERMQAEFFLESPEGNPIQSCCIVSPKKQRFRHPRNNSLVTDNGGAPWEDIPVVKRRSFLKNSTEAL